MRKNKLSTFITFCLLFSYGVSAQASSNSKIEKFIKGNLSEKTAAVREASGKDAVWLCQKSLDFVLESKELLGEDRELDGLAVAAILSYPQDFISSASDQIKNEIIKNYISIFDVFSSSPNVQITVISKLNALSNSIDLLPFVKLLNMKMTSPDFANLDISVSKSCINFLSIHGDNESFIITYNLWNSKKFINLNNELEKCIISLIPISMNEAVSIACNSNLDKVLNFSNLIFNNQNKINENSLSELAENILSNSILLVRKSQKSDSSVDEVQKKCVSILAQNQWTRASSRVMEYFDYSKEKYSKKEMKEENFIFLIDSLDDIAPLDSVAALIEYLETLNSRVEKFESVSENVALAVINTLGAIGDKTAFDALLGVTYYAYPQSVLSAARDALSGLKW